MLQTLVALLCLSAEDKTYTSYLAAATKMILPHLGYSLAADL